MVAKLSSASTTSAASLVASVPLMPIATPTSACVRAGASLTPSPVMDTTSPCACSADTMRILCSGLVRAYTSTSRTTARSCSVDIASSSGPVSTAGASGEPGCPSTIPISRPIATAVPAWSPVIILTRMPASRHCAIAATASGRGGSTMPTSPHSSRPPATSSASSVVVPSSARRRAAARTRRPCPPSSSIRRSHRARSSGSDVPDGEVCVAQRSSTRSGAPLRCTSSVPSGPRSRVAMNLFSDSNGTTATRVQPCVATPAFMPSERTAPSVGSPTSRQPPSPPASPPPCPAAPARTIRASLHSIMAVATAARSGSSARSACRPSAVTSPSGA